MVLPKRAKLCYGDLSVYKTGTSWVKCILEYLWTICGMLLILVKEQNPLRQTIQRCPLIPWTSGYILPNGNHLPSIQPLITTSLSCKCEQKLLPAFPATALTNSFTQAIKYYCAEWIPVGSPTLSFWGFPIFTQFAYENKQWKHVSSFFAK